LLHKLFVKLSLPTHTTYHGSNHGLASYKPTYYIRLLPNSKLHLHAYLHAHSVFWSSFLLQSCEW